MLMQVLMTKMMMSAGGGTEHPEGGTSNGIFSAVWLKLIEILPLLIVGLFYQMQPIFSKIANKCCAEMTHRFSQYMENAAEKAMQGDDGKRRSSVRLYISKNSYSSRVDSIIDYILRECGNAQHVGFACGRTFIRNTNPFRISDDIEVVAQFNERDVIEKDYVVGSIELISTTLDVSQLRCFLEEKHLEYQTRLNNKITQSAQFFSHIPGTGSVEDTGEYSSNKQFVFEHYALSTTKSLNNVYGKHVVQIRKRLQHFIENPKWYREHGVPYTFGVLLHGPPGTGKTSFIKAIAKDTNRHIVSVNITQTTTQRSLRNLFLEEDIYVKTNGTRSNAGCVTVPIDKRLYVIEEIDCLGSVVADRNTASSSAASPLSDDDSDYDRDISAASASAAAENGEEKPASASSARKGNSEPVINLGFMLDLLDGILEMPGRIIIATTNHPEVLDRALIRPGRFDLNVHVGYCDAEMIREMYFNFFKEDANAVAAEHDFDFLNENRYQVTPAEVSCVLQNNIFDARDGYIALRDMVRTKIVQQV